jgi:hypothetical protein
MFPDDAKCHEKYRKLVSSLSRVLEIPEVYMCANKFAEINFKRVSSLCLNRFRKVFMNELVDQIPNEEEQETGNRFPENPDRVACREHLKESLKTGKINGKMLMPHEITSKICSIRSEMELLVFEEQWKKNKRRCC